MSKMQTLQKYASLSTIVLLFLGILQFFNFTFTIPVATGSALDGTIFASIDIFQAFLFIGVGMAITLLIVNLRRKR